MFLVLYIRNLCLTQGHKAFPLYVIEILEFKFLHVVKIEKTTVSPLNDFSTFEENQLII